MYRHGHDEAPRRGTPMQRRASIIGAIAIAVFAVLGLRLWYLQVLSGEDYRQQANDNRVSEIRVQAPRGEILDRDGKVLVANRTELAVQVQPDEMPKLGTPERRDLVKRLAPITGRHAAGDRAGDRRGARGLALEPGDPGPRARRRQGLLPAREPGELPRRHASSACSRATTSRATSAPTCSATWARSPPSSSGCRATPASSRATRSASRASSTSTTASCAASRAPAASRSTRWGGRPTS